MSTFVPLKVQIQTGVTIVEFGQEQRQLDELHLEKIGRQLITLAQSASPPRLVLDMALTEFFGSSFIEILLLVWKAIESRPDGKFAISGLQPYCREVLEVTHLDRLWPLPNTRAEAIMTVNA